ncbi:thioesterase family protein [Neorhizobium sp. T25_13]|uniref:acyl-CoA thioesterase n=1 Tax=Neorhizobium sp. T25_13 TaxID=2093830 RepID=UPI00155DFC9C|nr:acyl-CoA thioesterase [Neorhizobium sp. T25_13]
MNVWERTQPQRTQEANEGLGDKRPAFLHRHVVSFEETNVVGNVYFSRHVSWQGRCREMFLKNYVPSILDELGRDLRLVTRKVSCEYLAELRAFDEVEMRMRLAYIEQHRIGLDFDYFMMRGSVPGQLAARGFQEIGCMRTQGGLLVAVSPPKEMRDALCSFMTR